ncbi:transcription factor MYBS3-like [Cucurbita maxima]|uniref:Transcription factor MYBS3-like n=1 Tax=Cucurbita maxima TaxID=3661 RepID=A0A6J1KFP3_CUCMA|nr:transcription factor MYBS3-like [Cucurbita maxima]
MTRRCSHCSNNGHNSRTCPSRGGRVGSGTLSSGGCGGGVKLFGVRLTDGSFIKKSASMGNLSAHYHSSSSAAASPNPDSPNSDAVHDTDGFLSDDPSHASCSANRGAERKKGVPWTEEEHRLFLFGLQKLGKGDWRGISRNFVITRTPTQVASHAQKYFIRLSNATRRKRRSSLFDMVPETETDLLPAPEDEVLHGYQAKETENTGSQPSLNLSLNSEFHIMETAVEENGKELDAPKMEVAGFPPMIPGYISAYVPVPFSIWAPSTVPMEEEKGVEMCHHEVLKPIPVVPKKPVNVDELVGMSQLTLREHEREHKEPSPLTLKLISEPSRRLSAFHPNARVSRSELNKGDNDTNKAL